jgi:tetratricopeptide (TPR) repeat protein
LWLGRRFDEAIAQADRVLELDPHYPMALIRLGVAYSAKGMHAHAVRAFRKAEKAAPELPDSIALLGHTYAIAGNKRAALKQLDELGRLAERRYVPAFLFAEVYLGLGDLDEALRLLEQEYDARGWYLLMLKQGPQFDPLRSHPRFHALMSRMNFPNPSISP